MFGAFHGFAHGAAIPAAGSAALYALGFVLATGAVLGLVTALGLVARTTWSRVAIRFAGATAAALGVVIVGGAI